ncbi:MAG TPA: C39 family peptidase, partial [Ktedonobacterales bacterium]
LSLSAAGEPSQPLMAVFQTRSGSYDARAITTLVQPETQGTRPDLYDSKAQFDDWWNAACSAAALSEILTAWGVPHATIGKLIDVMQPDISLNGGLLTSHGFQRGAEAFGYRADISSRLSYKQLLYITNVLGLPVIVNVRIDYGYYRFFSGGHFLVMTGGDSQGVKIVDSSEYYIHYLPLDTFNSMFTGITAIIVPKDYQYSVPSI